MSAPLPMHSLMETWVPVCGIVCLSQSPYFWTHTLVRMCTCINLVFMSTQLPMLAQHPMDSYMETWVTIFFISSTPCSIGTWNVWVSSVWHYFCVCHTIGLECVHASVHIFMSTWLPISPQTPMHSYMETWVPLCGSVFVSQSPLFLVPHLV